MAEQDRLAKEGRELPLEHYWSSDTGMECIVFDGQKEVRELAEGRQPIHLGPFVNHADEGTPEHNVDGVHIRVNSYCFIV